MAIEHKRSEFTLPQKIFVIRCYYETGESIGSCLDGLQTKYGNIFDGKDAMNGIGTIVSSFERHGSVRNSIFYKPASITEDLLTSDHEDYCDEKVTSFEAVHVELEVEPQDLKFTPPDDEDDAGMLFGSESGSEFVPDTGEGDHFGDEESESEEEDKVKPVKSEEKADFGESDNPDNSRMVLCTDCGAMVDKRGMFSHKKLHQPAKEKVKKDWICDVCNKKLYSKDRLTKHKKTHLDPSERVADQIICETCGKVSLSKELHRMHIRIHTVDKPYQCNFCGSGFRTPQYLARHKLTHTGEKPQSCDICGENFRGHTALINHKRRHTGERPCACPYCDETFPTTSNLNAHVKSHHKEHVKTCPICKKKYRNDKTLEEHIQTKHPVRIDGLDLLD